MPHVFTATDRIPNPLVSQMGFAEGDPFFREFRVLPQKRHEVAGKSCASAGADRTDDELGRDIDKAQLDPAGGLVLVHQLVKDLRIGIDAAAQRVLIVFLPKLEGLIVLKICFLATHGNLTPNQRMFATLYPSA